MLSWGIIYDTVKSICQKREDGNEILQKRIPTIDVENTVFKIPSETDFY